MLKPIPDEPLFTKSDYFYKNAKTPRMLFYNEVLRELYSSSVALPKKKFEEYLFTEREERWKRKTKLDQMSKDIQYMMSENPACIG